MNDLRGVDSIPEYDYITWYNSEGGRRCLLCGRYGKQQEMAWLGPTCRNHGSMIVCSAKYGHLPGFGCRKNETGISEEGKQI